MAPSTSFPPLNSSLNYHTYVSANHHHKPHDDPSLSLPEFSIKVNVNVNFFSEDLDEARTIRGNSVCKTFPVVCDFVTSGAGKPTPWGGKLVSNMLSHMSIPLPLSKIQWKGKNFDGVVMSMALLDDEEDVVEYFLEFLCCVRVDPYNATRKILPVSLCIEEQVILEKHEFERLVTGYDHEQKGEVSVNEEDKEDEEEEFFEVTLDESAPTDWVAVFVGK